MELVKYSPPMQSDRWTRKIDERKKKREHFRTVAQTIDELIDDVCQSTRGEGLSSIFSSRTFGSLVSSSLSIDVSRTTRSDQEGDTPCLSDSMEILINHLCDDQETREIRSSIENRYRQLINEVDDKLEKILSEHQSNTSFVVSAQDERPSPFV